MDDNGSLLFFVSKYVWFWRRKYLLDFLAIEIAIIVIDTLFERSHYSNYPNMCMPVIFLFQIRYKRKLQCANYMKWKNNVELHSRRPLTKSTFIRYLSSFSRRGRYREHNAVGFYPYKAHKLPLHSLQLHDMLKYLTI